MKRKGPTNRGRSSFTVAARNTRRIYLIDKMLDSGLTPEEEEELDLLQNEAKRIRDDMTESQYTFLDKYK